MKNWKPYALGILFSETVGILSGWLARGGMAHFRTAVTKPSLSPPDWVFPVVWAVLYALMGIGAARVWLIYAAYLNLGVWYLNS